MDLKEEFDKLDLPKAFLVGFGIVAVYWVVFFDDGQNLRNQIAQAIQTQNKNRAALKQVEQALANKETFDKEIKHITRNMKDFNRYFDPTGVDTNFLQGKISNLAEQHGLLVNEMKPSSRNAEFDNYKETAVEFKIEGPFHNIMEFISSLTKMKKAIDFSTMRFKTTVKGDYPLVELKTIMVIYSSNGTSEVNGA